MLLRGVISSDVEIITPENKTYYSSTITLTYHATFDFGIEHKWIVYSLDDGENITVYDKYNNLQYYSGSVTLSGLSSGKHHIDIYSKNGSYVFGTGRSGGWFDFPDRVYFTIDLSEESPTPTFAPTSTPTATPEPTPELESLPTSLVMASSLTVAAVVIGLGLLVYLIKRK